MDNKKINILYIIIIVLGLMYVIVAFANQKDLKTIKTDVIKTRDELIIVNKTMGAVIGSLESSTKRINEIISNLETSKHTIDSLMNKAWGITAQTKNKIGATTDSIGNVITDIKKEEANMKNLINQLNRTTVR